VNIDPADVQDEIYRAARQAANAYGGKFDVDDIAQAISLDMMTNPTRYKSIRGSLFMVILKRSGIRYCAEESARYLAFSEQYIYSSEEVKELLDLFYRPESWPNGLAQPVISDEESLEEFQGRLEEWNNATKLIIDMMDIEYAISKVSEAQRRVIIKRYRDKEKLANKYESNKHSEAIKYLTSHINQRMISRVVGNGHEGPGARRVISNASALAVTTDCHEGGTSYRDSMDALQWYERRNHPLSRRSKHVVNSPWR
jgi:hypothetical protein